MSPSRRRLGTPLHISRSSRNLILKAESSPRIGDVVLDGGGRVVGTVFDIFGPVSGPLVAVRPGGDKPEGYVGKELFLKGSHPEGRGKQFDRDA